MTTNKICTGTVDLKKTFYRDLNQKRLRTTGVEYKNNDLPRGRRIEVDEVELERLSVVASPNVNADDWVLQVRHNHHLEDTRWVRDAAFKVLKETFYKKNF